MCEVRVGFLACSSLGLFASFVEIVRFHGQTGSDTSVDGGGCSRTGKVTLT